MKTSGLFAVAALFLLGTVPALSQQMSQQTAKADSSADSSRVAKVIYACPMHPEVVSHTPGECPKCGMKLVKVTPKAVKDSTQTKHSMVPGSGDNAQAPLPSTPATGKEKALQAKALLNDAKKSLMKEGKYNCCIKDACDRCALDHQNCVCAADVKAGKAVCPDCYAGWQRGDGNVTGVSAKHVELSSHGHTHH